MNFAIDAKTIWKNTNRKVKSSKNGSKQKHSGNRARTGRQKLDVAKRVTPNKRINMKGGDGANGKSRMLERNDDNNNNNDNNKRKRLQHEESMTTKHDSNKQQLLTEESDDSENDSMTEEDTQDNSSRRDSQDVEKRAPNMATVNVTGKE